MLIGFNTIQNIYPNFPMIAFLGGTTATSFLNAMTFSFSRFWFLNYGPPGLGGGCISCHEGLALAVSEDAALPTATLRQQAARREDTSSRM